MLGKVLVNKTVQSLEKGLEAASLRHQVIANNLANVNTPGFKRSRVDFEGELKKFLESEAPGALSLAATQPGHLGFPGSLAPGVESPRAELRVVSENSTTMRNDGNNVDLETEMVLMSENSIWYGALTRQIAAKFAGLRYVISEGRR